ncbi:DUF6547 family protein [Gallibacterium salpingitidis]|uniref:Uncharacterized protein n=1 Tax=Gallibacterium salpingitidis TaxID=505341 RepID=A0A1A7NY61_9PAST|nr:DUF6547 family protein [Gallibacterium salpingitidis]OBW94431.1 hypothetical protein QS62_06110 [Gallibacterium salpingitidis]
MDNLLESYKDFIDGLVEKRRTVKAKWVVGTGYPHTETNKEINNLLEQLTAEQKEILANMLSEAKEEGIHDTLAYMNELFDTEGYGLTKDGESLPYDAFESMHYDFVCRCEGDEWPEGEDE